jgi:hypothetical protein
MDSVETAAGASSPDEYPAPPTQDARYVGVRGWLLFFCVSLCILSPLASAFMLVRGTIANAPYFARFPGLLLVTIASAALAVALMALAIVAGVALWQVKPDAVRGAKLSCGCRSARASSTRCFRSRRACRRQ